MYKAKTRITMKFLALITFFTAIITDSYCLENGAPCSSIEEMKPRHKLEHGDRGEIEANEIHSSHMRALTLSINADCYNDNRNEWFLEGKDTKVQSYSIVQHNKVIV